MAVDDKVPPVPVTTDVITPVGEEQVKLLRGQKFTNTWNQWFIALKAKVDIINASIVGFSKFTGVGFITRQTDGTFVSRTITGTSGEVSVANGAGTAGNPTIGLIATGVTAGSYGDSTHWTTFTVDSKGRLTLASQVLAPVAGTVTSVGLSLPSIFTVAGSPVTTSGTLTGNLNTQSANLVWAGPASGSAAIPTFRALVSLDIPNLDWAKITTGKPTTLSGYGITDAVFAGAVTTTTFVALTSNSTNSTSFALRNTAAGGHGYAFFSSGGGPSTAGQFGIFDETAGSSRLLIDTSGNTAPGGDNAFSCGKAAQRWTTVFAVTGTINTSDARDKTPVSQLNSNEVNAAKVLAKEIGTYQWLDMVKSKGADKARLHIGITVQRVIQVLQSYNLDPMRYGFICYDSWEYQPAGIDDTGNILSPEILAGDLYSFRTDELLLFLARGFDARISNLEDKVL